MQKKIFYGLELGLCCLFLFSMVYDVNILRASLGFISIFVFFTCIIKNWITGKEYGITTLALLALFIIIFCVQTFLFHTDIRYETSKIITLIFTQAFFIYSSLYIRNHIKAY